MPGSPCAYKLILVNSEFGQKCRQPPPARLLPSPSLEIGEGRLLSTWHEFVGRQRQRPSRDGMKGARSDIALLRPKPSGQPERYPQVADPGKLPTNRHEGLNFIETVVPGTGTAWELPTVSTWG